MYQSSILNYLPSDEFQFFDIFKIKCEINNKSAEIFKWQNMIGFRINDLNLIVKPVDNTTYNTTYNTTKFIAWKNNENYEIFGIINNGNFVDVYIKYLNTSKPRIEIFDFDKNSTMNVIEFEYAIKLIDMILMIENIKYGVKIKSYMSPLHQNSLLDVFRIKLNNNLSYYLYYEDTMDLICIERIEHIKYNSNNIDNIKIKILKRQKYVTEGDIFDLNKIN